MKKMLMLASVASMISQFNMSNIEQLKRMGYSVDVACNFKEGNTCSDDEIARLQNKLQQLDAGYYQIDFSRSINNMSKNITALKQVEELLKKNNYDFLHCHSPIGGVVGRIVGKRAGTKVIYTAHGFHFYKGAPLLNWLIYYPVEKLCSRWTDVLITINKEDYELAQKKMKAKKVEYVPGVGIDLNKFSSDKVDKKSKRKELEIPNDATLLLSVGELNQNKNHELVIKALSELDDNVHYMIAGQGERKEYLKQLAKELNVEGRVHLLGYRNDVKELYSTADVFVFPSFREGLSVSLMEAMASGLPCVVSKIRGNVDLIEDKKGGLLFSPDDAKELTDGLKFLLQNPNIANAMGEFNTKQIEIFGEKEVLKKINQLYERVIE